MATRTRILVGFGIGTVLVAAVFGAQSALQLPGRPAPDLARLFLPRHAPAGTYDLAVLDLPLGAARDRVMATLAPGVTVDPQAESDAWKVVRLDPLEAYGDAGLYDRSRLARLYTGRPALVVRAPIRRAGRVVGSVTLISPHPDAALTRLVPGTMAILFRAFPGTGGEGAQAGKVP
jgi:hypothetical protein